MQNNQLNVTFDMDIQVEYLADHILNGPRRIIWN